MSQQEIDNLIKKDYAAGFVTDVDSNTIPPGLSEEVIRVISGKKDEPEWLLEWRLKAYEDWKAMVEPEWAHIHHPKIDFNEISYLSLIHI